MNKNGEKMKINGNQKFEHISWRNKRITKLREEYRKEMKLKEKIKRDNWNKITKEMMN